MIGNASQAWLARIADPVAIAVEIDHAAQGLGSVVASADAAVVASSVAAGPPDPQPQPQVQSQPLPPPRAVRTLAEVVAGRLHVNAQGDIAQGVVGERAALVAQFVQTVKVAVRLNLRHAVSSGDQILEEVRAVTPVVIVRVTGLPATSVPVRTSVTPRMPASSDWRTPSPLSSLKTTPARLDPISPKFWFSRPPDRHGRGDRVRRRAAQAFRLGFFDRVIARTDVAEQILAVWSGQVLQWC